MVLDVPKTYKLAYAEISAQLNRPAVFFDRDGVLNEDKGYTHKPEQFVWKEGAIDAIRHYNEKGYLVIVVTNQAGIGRGYYSEEHFHKFTGWIQTQLAKHHAHFDAVYYCPHHPEAGVGDYRKECNCRKPRPGMLLQAIADWSILKDGSFLVGDSDSDLKAAFEAGISSFKYIEGNLLDFCIRAEQEV